MSAENVTENVDFIGTWYILFQTGKNKAPFKITWYILFQTGKSMSSLKRGCLQTIITW